MKDPVLESYLKEFASEYSKSHLPEAEQFEHFINYCVMAKHYTEPFDPDNVAIGGSGDLGIDGIGVFVNDHLCLSAEEVDYFRKTLRRLDVEFVFVQSKTSSKFDGGEIGTFVSGVRQFFDKQLPITSNPEVNEFHKLKQYIYDLTIDMDRPPVCHLYYATTGVWLADPALTSRVTQAEADLFTTGLFDSVNFTLLDAEKIKKTHREIKNKVVRELVFEKHTILPEINGVTEAYIGVVPAKEYLKILCDDAGILNRRLFFDNVRDFQGHNHVNSEIRSTITEAENQDRFALLNNGVTVVAKDLNKVGSRFKLRDYQVVNGCQTSHVLYHARDSISDNVYLPLKLIVTGNTEVANRIIQGTNSQTEVLPEAFESLSPFQKELEEVYIAVSKNLASPVYYERRSKQYDDISGDRERVVTLTTQIKCFVGMFLNEPHSTHRYYGELLDSYRSRIFSEAHRHMPYVTAGVALIGIERLFSEDAIPKSARGFKHQLLMAFRLKFGEGELPALNSKAMDDYCAKLLAIVNVPEKFAASLNEVWQIVEAAVKAGKPWKEPPERTKSFTISLIQEISGKGVSPATASRISGKIDMVSSTRGFGFIKTLDMARKVYFSIRDVALADGRQLDVGTKVDFVVVEGPKGPKAISVEISSR